MEVCVMTCINHCVGLLRHYPNPNNNTQSASSRAVCSPGLPRCTGSTPFSVCCTTRFRLTRIQPLSVWWFLSYYR